MRQDVKFICRPCAPSRAATRRSCWNLTCDRRDSPQDLGFQSESEGARRHFGSRTRPGGVRALRARPPPPSDARALAACGGCARLDRTRAVCPGIDHRPGSARPRALQFRHTEGSCHCRRLIRSRIVQPQVLGLHQPIIRDRAEPELGGAKTDLAPLRGAIVWGPIAGYFRRQQPAPLVVPGPKGPVPSPPGPSLPGSRGASCPRASRPPGARPR